ncbi:MAG: vitamin K epoxide reductase family protein, partial [Anaerolineales bacterium]
LWMEGCPHCHVIIEDVLPPLKRQYGEAVEILLVQIETQEQVDALFAMAAGLGIPRDHVGVPFLLVGDEVLIGSADIPEHLPELLEQYYQSGGVPIPDIAGLDGLMLEAQVESFTLPNGGNSSTSAAVQVAEPVETPDGFGLAIAVLIGMLVILLYGLGAILRAAHGRHVWLPPASWSRFIPILAVLGIGVAAYLSFIETQNAVAVCGPVGDCNAVQQSKYASIFGVPVGVLGLAGYGLILAAWWMGTRRAVSRWGKLAPTALFVMTSSGLLFSAYLTYLEPFVIRAVCLWCLSSSVIIALLFLLSLSPFRDRISD